MKTSNPCAGSAALRPGPAGCIFIPRPGQALRPLPARERKFEPMFSPSIRSLHCLGSAAFCALAAILFLPPPAVAATRNLTGADQGKTIQLTTGDTLVVRLESNASTGFAWYVKKGSTALLKLDSQDRIAPENANPGTPGAQVFTFRANGPGKGDLLLHYVRSWEKPQPDEQTFTVHLTIE